MKHFNLQHVNIKHIKKLFPLLLTTSALTMSSHLSAETTIYGLVNVSAEHSDVNSTTTTSLASNASRLGFKGKETINETLDIIYKAEFGIDVDDGNTGDGNAFKKRDIYVGIKSPFGKLLAGSINTPLKKAQKKVDLFNHLKGDIKSIISNNDTRSSNSVAYYSPKHSSGIATSIFYIASEDPTIDDGFSANLSYTTDYGLYLAVAADHSVNAAKEGDDTLRAVAQYNHNALQLGVLFETYEKFNSNGKEGWILSSQYTLNHIDLKLQYGQSDIIELNGESLSVGADYHLSKSSKVFAFATINEGDGPTTSTTDDTEKHYVGAGIQHKF